MASHGFYQRNLSCRAVHRAINELYAEKDYDWPFWLSYDEIEKGATATPAEFDYMFDWRNNPMAALPNWITISARKQQH